MAQIRNNDSRIYVINVGGEKGGAKITLLPGLNDVDDEKWKKALVFKWTAKLMSRDAKSLESTGRKAIEGPTELGGVKLFGLEAKEEAEKKTEKKTEKETGKKKPEDF